MSFFTLQASQTALLIIDMQEKIFDSIPENQLFLHHVLQLTKSFQILNLPIILSEQYPKGLGETLPSIKQCLSENYQPWCKTTFSCLKDREFFNYILSLPYSQWIIVGMETHICVLQTVKDLLQIGKQVTVIPQAVTSQALENHQIALSEMIQLGVRISSVETILFELMQDSNHPHFKAISQVIKTPFSKG